MKIKQVSKYEHPPNKGYKSAEGLIKIPEPGWVRATACGYITSNDKGVILLVSNISSYKTPYGQSECLNGTPVEKGKTYELKVGDKIEIRINTVSYGWFQKSFEIIDDETEVSVQSVDPIRP